ncbi:alpha/beta hydrolase [Brevundimonas sp. 2R-24]|uniref:Alpha/beta hydrolase n=1 Tax=Peiella sedimenti TaxID=3061083 RepID=A0ABT8SKN1_9CAUL|nr:alpha/beta hydrolase [Caulobacteraceae bacterium XZ-24]
MTLRLLAAAAAAFTFAAAPLAHAETAWRDRITVQTVGQGPDVILIPGLSSSRQVFAATAERLSAEHRVHLVQVRGFAGDPPPEDADRVFDPLVEALGDYIRQERLDAPAIIGHSMGGAAALALAAREPDLPGRVMIVDALPFYPLLFSPTVTVETARPFADQARSQLLALDEAGFRQMQEAAAATLSLTPEARTRIVADGLASTRSVQAQAVHELMTTDLRAEFGQVRAPVTVLYAWDASMGRPATAADALFGGGYDGLAGVGMVRIDGSLHFIMDDQPGRFAHAVDAFLEAP